MKLTNEQGSKYHGKSGKVTEHFFSGKSGTVRVILNKICAVKRAVKSGQFRKMQHEKVRESF